MTERALLLLEVVMDMISGSCDMMEEDEFHAPAKWLMENWWATLNLVRGELTSSSSSNDEQDA
jgi:hypothetical protein